MKQLILKHTLKNALDFGGKANPKVVLGLVLRENPDLKKDVPKLLKEINKTVKEVEKLSEEKIKEKLKKDFPELLKKEKKVVEGPLKPLPNAKKGKVVTRIAPSPSGPLHIGHAYGASLNYEYAKMYDGKLILRIEDTNPDNIYPDAYKLIEEDVKWLTDNNVDKLIIQSERLGKYYDYAEELVQKDKAYVCDCNPDEWRKLKNDGKACSCRDFEDQNVRYQKMFNEYAEGEVVLRLKTDIQDKNPAMRDFALLRVNEHVHPKTGKEQRVWPLMVFSVAIDDYELGVTHVMNGKEHADNSKKETLIMKALGWKAPEYLHWGRINFQGMKISASETKLKIEQNEFHGWDDIRLPFLPALRKRGYQPEAFRKFALEIGLSLNDKTVSKEEFWKLVNAFNKEIIEPKANRYFMVDNPTKIKVMGSPEKEVQIDLHPDFPKRGQRKFNVNEDFYISEKDYQSLGEGYLHRLMDCCNFKLENKRFKFISEDYEEYKNATDKGRIIHWLPLKENIKTEVLMENNEVKEGLGEVELSKVKENEIVQFERRFFSRINKKDKNLIRSWYLHK